MKDRINRSIRNFQITWAGVSAIYTLFVCFTSGLHSDTAIGAFLIMLLASAISAAMTPLIYSLPLKYGFLYEIVNISAILIIVAGLIQLVFGLATISTSELIFSLVVFIAAYALNTFMIMEANRQDAKKINRILQERQSQDI